METSARTLGTMASAVTSSARRIAVVTDTYAPDFNGAAPAVTAFVQALSARGHAIHLIRPRPAAQRDRTPGLASETLISARSVAHVAGVPIGWPDAGSAARAWKDHQPELVHVATEGPLGQWALRGARQLGLPVTTDFRTNYPAFASHYRAGWMERPMRGLLRTFHNKADCTIVPTAALRAELESSQYRQVAIVGRGVDGRVFDPQRRSEALRSAWGLAHDDVLLAFVGRLAPEKNLDLLVRSHDAIRRLLPRARLLVVGDGPLQPWLARSIPDARMLGRLEGVALATHLACADMLFNPSLTETYSGITLEAMACAVPVLAFHHAAAAEHIEPGLNGMTVPFGDLQGFERAAVRLAARRGLRLAMGERARARSLCHTWESAATQFEAVMRGVLRHARRPILA